MRAIYARYLELGSVHRLADELAAEGVTSKIHQSANGKVRGGTPLGRGALFHLLRNKVYLGKIPHKGEAYDGEHQPIIDPDLFDAVQHQLACHAHRRGNSSDGTAKSSERKVESALLTGRLRDAHDELMSPAFSRGRSGRLYRYYVSSPLQRGKALDSSHVLRRVPAPAIEQLVTSALARLLPGKACPLDLLLGVHLRPAGVELVLPSRLGSRMRGHLAQGEGLHPGQDSTCIISLPTALPLRGGRRSIEAGRPHSASPDPILIAALRRAHSMLRRDAAGYPVINAAPVSPYERRVLRLAFLAPDIQRDILAGRQPRALNLEMLMHADIPLEWSEQRRALGWNA